MSLPSNWPSSTTGQNPFAESVNPYAAPREEGYIPPTQRLSGAPFAGLWRQGNLLVMHKEAPLPLICVKSNQPATGRLKRSLAWHHPALYLIILLNWLIYIVVALIVRKTAMIQIALSDEWIARRKRRMVFAWSAILLCVVLFVMSLFLLDSSGLAPVVLLVSIVGCLAAMGYGLVACRLVSARRMTDTYIWLKGVHPDFLDRLEPWPWNI
jgi:hypothetical protein